MKPLYPTILKYLEDQPILSGLDQRMLRLFIIYDETISELLEVSRPQNNEWCIKDYSEWAKEGNLDIDFIGPTFHKLFRQIDVLPTAKEDMDVWKALSEHSEFWPALEEALNA